MCRFLPRAVYTVSRHGKLIIRTETGCGIVDMNLLHLSFLSTAIVMSSHANSAQAVEIIGHRGASFDAPENTLASVNLAWKQNADAVEIDIYLSRDGHIVAVHDETTKRYGGPDKNIAEPGELCTYGARPRKRFRATGNDRRRCAPGRGTPTLICIQRVRGSAILISRSRNARRRIHGH